MWCWASHAHTRQAPCQLSLTSSSECLLVVKNAVLYNLSSVATSRPSPLLLQCFLSPISCFLKLITLISFFVALLLLKTSFLCAQSWIFIFLLFVSHCFTAFCLFHCSCKSRLCWLNGQSFVRWSAFLLRLFIVLCILFYSSFAVCLVCSSVFFQN